MRRSAPSTDAVIRVYLAAKRQVIDGGYDDEIAWQTTVLGRRVSTQTFMRETAWVILCSGMSERVVRSRFALLSEIFERFQVPRMVRYAPEMRSQALEVFGHERKIESILAVARIVDDIGQAGLNEALSDPEAFLQSLPHIGPVTWRHLAKNLGFPVAKGDRHLVRIAAAMKRDSVDDLCGEISGWLGEPIPVVDVVLWRWAVLHSERCRGSCLPTLELCPSAPPVISGTVKAYAGG